MGPERLLPLGSGGGSALSRGIVLTLVTLVCAKGPAGAHTRSPRTGPGTPLRPTPLRACLTLRWHRRGEPHPDSIGVVALGPAASDIFRSGVWRRGHKGRTCQYRAQVALHHAQPPSLALLIRSDSWTSASEPT